MNFISPKSSIQRLLFSAILAIACNFLYAQLPVITSNPTSQSVCAFDTARYLISVSNFTDFTWQYSLNGTDWTDIASNTPQHSATSPYNTYSTVGGVVLQVGTNSDFINTIYMYRCNFSNSGGPTVTSDVVTQQVNLQMLEANPGADIQVCSSGYRSQTNTNIYIDAATCSAIDSVIPSGVNPYPDDYYAVTCVKIDASVQSYNGVPYVQRHYYIDIEYGGAGPTSTATIKLYFTQADFDNYNAVRGGLPALPTNPLDVTGISNIRITQFHGTGTTPGTFVGTGTGIDPDDNKIIWNAVLSRWEISFDITGFSGFFLSSNSLIPLPLTLLEFNGNASGGANLLKWQTTAEINVSHFEIERSEDDIHFEVIGKTPAINQRDLTNNYAYRDIFNGGSKQLYYYRLNMIDIDGNHSYSKIVAILPFANGLSVQISPNPFKQLVSINATSPADDEANISISDVTGKVIIKKKVFLQKGANTIYLNDMGQVQQGIYLLSISTKTDKRTIRLLKQE